jgi:hypothetical protein
MQILNVTQGKATVELTPADLGDLAEACRQAPNCLGIDAQEAAQADRLEEMAAMFAALASEAGSDD